MQLRFTSFAVINSWRDLHPQECAHAGRTHKESLHQIVNRLDIMLPGSHPFVAPGAVIHARQRLGSEAVRRVFTQTSQLWHNATPHPHWCGLPLLAIDGVYWRTPDTPENDDAFPRQTHGGKPGLCPQVKIVCQMELTSHLLTAMTDPMRYPGGEMADLYSNRRETEPGYREIKQTMQLSRLTLRSKKAELVKQELWGVLLAYNLVRYQTIKMAGHLKGYWPNQLSFSASCGMVMRMLMTLQRLHRAIYRS